MSDNRDQVEYWSGEAGERWVAAQQTMDRTLRPMGEAAMAAAELAPGMRVIDVGCGCGDTTVALAARVGATGSVLGVDVSAPMIARARERVGDRPIELRREDAAVAELPKVDRVFSRFGVMFFADPVAAFANLRSALVPNGRLAFVCWRSVADNPWARITIDAANTVLGAPSPSDPHAPGPFAFADRERVRTILEGAGFEQIRIEPFDADLVWTESSEEAVRDTWQRVGPVARRLADAEPTVAARALDAIVAAMRPSLQPRGLVLGAGAWVVTAS